MQKRARERGRSIIDSEFLTEIRNESMLRVAKCIRGFGFEELSMDAFEVAKAKMRRLPRKVAVIEEIKAFLGERTQKNEMVLAKFQRYLEMIPGRGLPWTEEALAQLERAPAFVRTLARQTIEAEARRRGEKVVTPEVVEHALGAVPPHPAPPDAPHLFSSPPGERQGEGGEDKGEGAAAEGLTILWSAAAEERLRRIPIPAIRRMVVERVEAHAREQGLTVVDLDAYEVALGK